MKKTVALILTAVLLIMTVIIPVNSVSAAEPEYLKHYTFSFAQEDLYSYAPTVKGQESSTEVTVNSLGGGEAKIQPFFPYVNYANNWTGNSVQYAQYGEDNADSLQFTNSNQLVVVPIMENGQPFELAPGHTYTVCISYSHTCSNAASDNWYANKGFIVGGGVLAGTEMKTEYRGNYSALTAFGSNSYVSRPYAVVVDTLRTDTSSATKKAFTFTTPAAQGDGYTYDAQKNAYTTTATGIAGDAAAQNELTLYNYLFMSVDRNAVSTFNITYLEVIRDDYVPPVEEVDWDEVTYDYYNFDMSKQNAYTDLTTGNKLEAGISYTTAPISIDAGYGRLSRNVYPVSSAMTPLAIQNNWGTQVYTNKNSIMYEGEEVPTAKYWTGTNPATYMPLTDEGKPLELAPGHTYTVKLVYELTALSSTGNNPQLQVNVGAASTGEIKNTMVNGTYVNALCYKSEILAWHTSSGASKAGQIITGTVNIKTPDVDDANYNYDHNTYTLKYDGVDYTLYNYLYFFFNSWQGPTVNFISIEVTRDDYVPQIDPVDWDTALKSHYNFNFSSEYVGYMADKQDEYSYNRLDDNYTWTESPVVIDSGFGRGERNIYPAWSSASKEPWGPQIHSWPETITYNDEATQTMAVKQENPGAFIPLQKNGKPFEFAPGHSYTVKIVLQKNKFDGNSATELKVNAGYPTGSWVKGVNIDSEKLVDITAVKGSEGEILTGEATITIPAADSENYNEVYNTFKVTVDNVDYTLYNYLYIESAGYTKAQINLISLEVIRDDYVPTDYTDTYLVSDCLENNSTYKIDFEYQIKGEISKKCGIAFKYAKDDGNFVTYVEGKNKALYTIPEGKEQNNWYTATVLLTTDMYALVEDSIGYDDTITAVSKLLYLYVIDEDDAINLEIKNITANKLVDSVGNDLINVMGASRLTDEAEAVAGSQALRYMFTYDTKTGSEISIDGTDYTIKERGFIYANGNLYAKGGTYKGDMNITNAKNGDFLTYGKTQGFDSYWDSKAIDGTDYHSLVFSTYITDFKAYDTKECMIKAYLIVEVEGQLFTIYSDSINRSVAYLKGV